MEGQTNKRAKLHPFVSSDGWRGLVWDGWEEEFRQLDVWLADHRGELVVDKPNRSVSRVETSRGQVYVKRIQRLADGRHFWRDILKCLRWYVRPSRALRVARISESMLRDGVGCPTPLLSVRRRDAWGVPCDVMISEGLSYPSVHNILMSLPTDELWAFLEPVIREITRIHGLGYVHGDGVPGNFLWDGAQAYLIDNDRTFKLSGHSWRKGCLRNIVQFCRDLEWHTQQVQSGERFMAYYNEVCMPSFRLTDRDCRLIQLEVRKRLAYGFRKNNMKSWLD